MRIPIEKARVFVEGLDHPEGLCVGPDGAIYAGGEAGQVYRIPPEGGRFEEVLRTGGFSLGMAFGPDGGLYVCDHVSRCVWRVDVRTRKAERFFDRSDGEAIRVPNYPAFGPDGSLYVSESGSWKGNDGGIYRVGRDGKGSMWTSEPIAFANGLCVDLAQGLLYCVESNAARVLRYDLSAPDGGRLREVFAEGLAAVPDGLALAEDGTLLVSCYAPSRIYAVSPDGRMKETWIEDPECTVLAAPTNVAFGGPRRSTLFTANLGRWHLTAIETEWTGAQVIPS